MQDLDSESDPDMTEREALAAERGAGARGGCGRQSPTLSVSLGRVDFGGINGSSSSSSSSSDDSNNINDSGDLTALVGRPVRDLEVFSELPAMQSGCTRFQPRGFTMTASYADVLLAYAMRTAEIERAYKFTAERAPGEGARVARGAR